MGVDLGHAVLDGLGFWSNRARGLGDLLFSTTRRAGVMCCQVIAVDGVDGEAIMGHWVAERGGWGSGC